MSDDTLTIIFGRVVSPKDGSVRRTFRARGFGPSSTNLSHWLRDIELTNEWSDMPWFGWEFTSDADEEILRRVWGSHFIRDDDDRFEEIKVQSELTPEQEEIATFFQDELMKAIQEEIDKEILVKIDEHR